MAHIRLHVRQADGHLPMVCMRCAEPATVLKTKNFFWYPRWIPVLIVLGVIGIIIGAILAHSLGKRARLQAPFCDEHKAHWLIRTTLAWGLSILAVLIGFGALAAFMVLQNRQPRPPMADTVATLLCVGILVTFVVWLIAISVLQYTTIRADEITNTHMLLNGVSEDFVNAVEEAEIERRVRLRQWEQEDEAEDMAPDRTGPQRSTARDGPGTDAIEEPRPRRPAPPPDAFEA